MAREIRALKSYVDPPPPAPTGHLRRQDFLAYFGGFFSGDGSLTFEPRRGRLTVKLRRDDRALLESFAWQFGIGNVMDIDKQPGSSPTAAWIVTARLDILRAIEILDSAPLLGVKRKHYRAWRPGALELAHASLEKRPVNTAIVQQAREELRAARRYSPRPEPIPDPENPRDPARSAFERVLQAWASGENGALGQNAYERARVRHPDWPTRNTIALAFGGWFKALEAAGLEHRATARWRQQLDIVGAP